MKVTCDRVGQLTRIEIIGDDGKIAAMIEKVIEETAKLLLEPTITVSGQSPCEVEFSCPNLSCDARNVVEVPLELDAEDVEYVCCKCGDKSTLRAGPQGFVSFV